LKLQIIGAGVVGKATGLGFQRYGHYVIFKDKGDTLEDADINLVCVPESEVKNVIQALMPVLKMHGLPVIRSTVPPSTTTRLSSEHNVHICHNPEFLREATSEYDFLNPTRIVIGECCEKHGDLLEELYKPFNVPIVRVDTKISEMVKLASNAYLATSISFWNEIHQICKNFGDSHKVGAITCMDPRISSYGARMHGKPFSGHCLPKDLDQLITFAKDWVGHDPKLLKAVKEVNEEIE